MLTIEPRRNGEVRITSVSSVPGIPERLSVYTDVRPACLESKSVADLIMRAAAEVAERAIAERTRTIEGVIEKGYW